jgi:hypothetical protein
MPWQVYVLIISWLVFVMWLVTWAQRKQRELPEVYLQLDLVLKFLVGRLPRGQQRLMVKYMLALFVSLVILALAIVVVMVG